MSANSSPTNKTNDDLGKRWTQVPTRLPDRSNEFDNGPVMALHVTLWNLACDRALESGALEPRKEDLKALTEHAEALARETWRDAYNPDLHPDHHLRDTEFKKDLADRSAGEDAVKLSGAEVRNKEIQLAQVPVQRKPTAHLLMAVFTVGIALTVAPTLHDFMYWSIDDDVAAWMLSFLTALPVAGAIVGAILGSVEATGRSAANWTGLVAGGVVSAGLALFRLAVASGIGELLLTAGLTLLEIGLIILAEWVAVGLRQQSREWATRESVRHQAEATLAAANSEHQRRLDRVAQLSRQITDHITFVQNVTIRNMNLAQLTDAVTKTVADGYSRGVALKRGSVINAGGEGNR